MIVPTNNCIPVGSVVFSVLGNVYLLHYRANWILMRTINDLFITFVIYKAL